MKEKNHYAVARENFIESLESLHVLVGDTIKRAHEVATLDSLDARIRGLHEKLHSISYILGAASAIKCLGLENSQFKAPDDDYEEII
jgi:hypothetical protein